MPLFVIRHHHDPERCPATDRDAGLALLNCLSRPYVRQQGVDIKGEAVVPGAHTLYMIVESNDEALVHEFMQPFGRIGSVEVFPALTWAGVVAAGGCATEVRELDETAPALDPEDACQRAIDAGLVVHRADPLNCETSIPSLIGGVVMPNAHFYVRNHFQVPALDPATWRLSVGGLVDQPLSLSLRDLTNMRSHTLVVPSSAPATLALSSNRRLRASNGASVPSARRNGRACRSSRCSTAPA